MRLVVNEYRMYHLDANGRIARGFNVACEDDQSACNKAQQMLGVCREVEVWMGTRCVARVSVYPPFIVPFLVSDPVWPRAIEPATTVPVLLAAPIPETSALVAVPPPARPA